MWKYVINFNIKEFCIKILRAINKYTHKHTPMYKDRHT